MFNGSIYYILHIIADTAFLLGTADRFDLWFSGIHLRLSIGLYGIQ